MSTEKKGKGVKIMKKILIFAGGVALTLGLVLAGCKGRAEQQAEVQRLQTEITNAKTAAKTAADNAKKERDELMAQLKTRTQERDALQKQLNDLQEQAASFEQLKQQVTKLSGERQQLQKQFADATTAQNGLQQKLTDATRARDSLQKEVETLASSQQTAVAEAKAAQAKCDELTAKLQTATEKVTELEEQLQTSTANSNEGGGAPTFQAIESPVIRSFTTTRPRIGPGQKSTLSWWVTDADNVRIEPYIGPVGVLGSRTIAPTKTTTYTLTATNKNGMSTVTRRIEVQ
jgi:predicted  nucleic acid-binding Zn-ribbon protein